MRGSTTSSATARSTEDGGFPGERAIPALNRLGHQPIGVFEVVAGAITPSIFVLVPMRSLDALASMEASLAKDTEFLKAGATYIDATAADPAYDRREMSVLAAFAKMPRIQLPAQTATKSPRLFELRTYEGHSEKAHRSKVRMFEARRDGYLPAGGTEGGVLLTHADRSPDA